MTLPDVTVSGWAVAFWLGLSALFTGWRVANRRRKPRLDDVLPTREDTVRVEPKGWWP